MDYYSGFPKGKNFTCIAEDRQGRIWAGTDDSGVAVFNGREWKMYDRSNALNGEHVYALAISPVSGEVAVATSGGVSIYDPAGDSWKTLDRSTGLVEDQAASAGFDTRGNLWLAYACGGVSCSSRQSKYMQWKNVQAPWYWDNRQFARQPYQPYGDGLPSNICNVLTCTDKGQVLVGTCSGLAYSNGISSWRYMRGRDYAQKIAICMVLPHGRLRCRGSRIPECCLKILFLPLFSRERKFSSATGCREWMFWMLKK